MSYFVVEHRKGGSYTLETITGVEDIDTSMYQPFMGLWVCATEQEAMVMENELRKMRHERSGQPS